MGRDIDRETFDESDFVLFRERLEACLAVLEEVLKRPGFGTGPATIGAELELVLVDNQFCSTMTLNCAFGLTLLDSRMCSGKSDPVGDCSSWSLQCPPCTNPLFGILLP